MARETQRLNARSVLAAKPGRHADGDGLYLVVEDSGAKRWQFHFRLGGKSRREMGLGSLNALSLADARKKAAAARKLVGAGINPIEERIAVAKAKAAEETTFGAFCDEVVPAILANSRNAKHIWQWDNTLKGFAGSLRDVPISRVDTEDVLAVLQQSVTIKINGKPKTGTLWQLKSETASRLRGRIERILDAAATKGLRTGENPARWRNHLQHLLPVRTQLSRGHHPAMPYADVADLLVRLRDVKGTGAIALRFLILTAARTGEVMGARWSEFDLETAIWTVPAERMKAGNEHRVPLVPTVVALLRSQLETRHSDFVFNGIRPKTPMSNGTMMKALRTAGGVGLTVHGFRSSFRDWVGEETDFPENIAEAALAHVVGDVVERAYRRGDALAKRRKLMEAWERYCLAAPKGNVIRLRSA